MKNIKNKIIAILCVAVCIMTIGYAAFSTIITIEGTANITSEWKVVFTKIEALSKTSGVNIKEESVEGTTATFDVGLTSPGDKIIYEITVENQGTLDAIINDIRISETGNEYIIFDVENITEGSVLVAKASTTFNVIIEYSSNVTEQPDNLINKLTIEVDYTQNLGQTPGTPGGETGSNVTLTQAILRDNTAQNDATVDLGYTSEGCRFDSDSESVICNDNKKSNGLYYTNTRTENNETVYYYRGDVNNNYVKFGKTEGCVYNNEKVLYIINPQTLQTSETPTESQCLSTIVCDAGTILKENYGMDYRYVTGLDASTCTYLGGTPLGEKEEAQYGNYVDILWRIVRINEDGSIRIITEESVGNSKFNTNHDDNAYEGYMFGSTGQTGTNAYQLTHANNNPSAIKGVIDNWYINNTNLSSLRSTHLADAGFCNDRSVAPQAGLWDPIDTALGYGFDYTLYGSYNRLITNKKPQFACPNEFNDLFTTSTSTKGNKVLSNPIGLITADEVAYAGAVLGETNESMYLSGTAIWTMSPFYFNGSLARVCFVDEDGLAVDNIVDYENDVRPVINLKSTVEITEGNGTIGNPYIIK